MDRADALAQHGEIARELADLHYQLGNVLSAEREAKVMTFAASQLPTDKQRDNAAQVNSIQSTKDVFKIREEIAALEERRDHLRMVLAYGSA